MRNFTIVAAVAAAALAAPAQANEARAEVRGGIVWSGGQNEAIAGAALGYDFDLGSVAFAGVEVSTDTILVGGLDFGVGFTGRLGARLDDGKFYTLGGYTTEFCDGCGGNWHAGGGYQHSFGKVYGKFEYRHYFVDGGADGDALGVGVGVTF